MRGRTCKRMGKIGLGYVLNALIPGIGEGRCAGAFRCPQSCIHSSMLSAPEYMVQEGNQQHVPGHPAEA